MLLQLASGSLGFLIAYGLMPWVMKLARKYRVLDYPDSPRRIHAKPIPRLGGIAIFIATVLAVTLVLAWDGLDGGLTRPLGTLLPGMAIGLSIVFFTGVVDDQRSVRPAVKLVAQSFAALAVIAYGFRIDHVTVAGNLVFDLGLLSVPITLLWVVGMTNAFNLIDGIDGLAGNCALIGLSVCVGVDYFLHDSSGLVMTFALVGAVLAFLQFNRSPARIFLGDSGSMMLGFFLAVRTMVASTTDQHVTYALIPVFALAYPLTDTAVAIARRWLRGHPISRADGRHIHHQILALGLSARRANELIGVAFFGVAGMGISLVFAPPRITLAVGMGAMILGFVMLVYGIKWLRYSEFIELGTSVASVVLNARSHVRNKLLAGEIANKLQRARTPVEVSAMLSDCAADFNLIEIALVPGATHFPGPDARQISPVHDRPFRIDYPIAWEEHGTVREVVLRLWCERPNYYQHVGAERIASRLGPALEQWLKDHPGAMPMPHPVPHHRFTPREFSRAE